jgi:S-DNA-T family DNA segregation ATPase FtsK/SpoIIIE
VDAAFDVLADHSEDLWALAFATLGVLLAIGLYGGALGPVGHAARQGLGAAFGVSRFLVPPASAAAAVLLVAGRPRHEPARALLGLVLALGAVAGLADLAGGAPRLQAHTARLAGAGGWLGVLVGGPLRDGLSSWGATVVLVALALVSLVLFTGVTVRSAAAVCGRALSALWGVATARFAVLEDADETADPEETEEAAGLAHAPDAAEPGAPPESLAPSVTVTGEAGTREPGLDGVPSPPDEGSVAHPRPLPARGDQLALDLPGPDGQWRLPPLKMLSR